MVIFYSYENVYQRVDDMKTSHMIPLSFQPFGVLIPFGLPRRSVEKKNHQWIDDQWWLSQCAIVVENPRKSWKNILLPSGKRLHNELENHHF